MTKPAFLNLSEMLAFHEYQTCRHATSSYILPLSVTLRWLAGGSYIDIATNHRLPVSSLYEILDKTIVALDTFLKIEFPFRDEEFLRKESVGLGRGRSPLTGCCGALDGIAIRIKEPSSRDVLNSQTYYNRKGYHALNVQAVCDSRYRFLFVSAITPGSSHGSTALKVSALGELLSMEQGSLVEGYWLAGDDAYVYADRRLGQTETCRETKAVSMLQLLAEFSSHPHRTEQAFGMLIGRWGVFWRPLGLSAGKVAMLVSVCCKIQNYIIYFKNDEGMADDAAMSNIDSAHHSEAADTGVHLQDECDTDDNLHRRRRDLETSLLRIALPQRIRSLGLGARMKPS